MCLTGFEGIVVAKNVFRVPLVAWHDYDAFRALIKEAPSSHHDWAERFRKRTIEERQRGHPVHEIHVDPWKFAAYARLKGCATDLEALQRFLLESDPHGD